MKKVRALALSVVALGLAVYSGSLPAVKANDHEGKAGKQDIVAIASGAENFKTLVAAVNAAGLVETLQGKGPSRCSPRPMKHSRSCQREPWKIC